MIAIGKFYEAEEVRDENEVRVTDVRLVDIQGTFNCFEVRLMPNGEIWYCTVNPDLYDANLDNCDIVKFNNEPVEILTYEGCSIKILHISCEDDTVVVEYEPIGWVNMIQNAIVETETTKKSNTVTGAKFVIGMKPVIRKGKIMHNLLVKIIDNGYAISDTIVTPMKGDPSKNQIRITFKKFTGTPLVARYGLCHAIEISKVYSTDNNKTIVLKYKHIK